MSDRVNNLDLYKNIDFVISANGSALYEAAYFNKIGISAGLNPTSSFNIFKEPKTIKQYENFIINPYKVKLKKNCQKEILKLYYSYYFAQKDFFPKLDNNINLLYMNAFDSKDLLKYFKLINNYKK